MTLCLGRIGGVVFRDPLLNHLAELFSLLEQLFGFRFSCRMGPIVIHLIPFAPACIKIRDLRGNRCAHRDLNSLEGREVMPGTHDAVACTGDHHLCQLENRVVCRRKTSVGRKGRYSRVL